MSESEYLNIGCGTKYHSGWMNIDFKASGPEVMEVDILNGLPFKNDTFEVIYHSQVLEHLEHEKAEPFLTECLRVLKPGGTIRIIVPDLENIINEYKKHLSKNLTDPDEISIAGYDWIMLELFDQSVRNKWGGRMAEYLEKPELVNEKYILDRIGFVGKKIREQVKEKNITVTRLKLPLLKRLVRKIRKEARRKFSKMNFRERFLKLLLTGKEYEFLKIGRFRQSGEIHHWMYDRFSLKLLLTECGFDQIFVKSPFESGIPGWDKFSLDVKDGLVFDPGSLFIEAKKPL